MTAGTVSGMRHGTRATYSHHKCRCDECKRFNREYMRAYRHSNLTTPIATSMPAYNRAVARLIERHVAEFQRLVEDETAREVNMTSGGE